MRRAPGRRKGIDVPRPLSHIPLIPPLSWSDVDARFDHLKELVRKSGRDIPSLAFGRMTYASDGGPMRRVPTPSAAKHEGHIQSVKTRRTAHWEAAGERLLILESEVDTRVRAYACQPHRLDIYCGRLTHGSVDPTSPPDTSKLVGNYELEHMVYFPDMERQIDGLGTQIIEVKQDYYDTIQDLEYVRKIVAAKQFYDLFGVKFTILTANDDLSGNIISKNARLIAVDRHATLSTSDLLTMSLHMAQRQDRSTYGELVRELQSLNSLNTPTNRSKIHAAIVRRLLGVDLHRRISDTSPIWVLPSDPTAAAHHSNGQGRRGAGREVSAP